MGDTAEMEWPEVREMLMEWASDAHGEIEMSRRIAVLDYVTEIHDAWAAMEAISDD